MKRWLALFLAVLMTVSLAGCTQAPQPSTTPNTSSMSASTSTPSTTPAAPADLSETKALNLPWLDSAGADLFQSPWFDQQSMYPSLIFQTLMKYGPEGYPTVPALATGYTISDDALRYTFKLASGVKWHDGVAFTPDDIVFSVKAYILCPETDDKANILGIKGAKDFQAGKVKDIAGITTTADSVTFELEAPDGLFLSKITTLYFYPKHLLENVDPLKVHNDPTFWAKPIGCGPYKITEVSFPNYFKLERNDDYFGQKPKIKTILFTSYVTGGTKAEYAAAIAGNLDYFTCLDINEANNIIASNPDTKMIKAPGVYNRFFMVNQNSSQDGKLHPDITKKEVRQAINLAIDKAAIVEAFYKGQGEVATTRVSSESPLYNQDIPQHKRDVEKAKQLLKDANFDFSHPIRICYYYSDQTSIDTIAAIKSNLEEIGMKVDTFLDQGDLVSILYDQRNYELLYAGGGGTDAILQYRDFFVPDGGLLDGVYGNVQFRKQNAAPLIERYINESDPSKKKADGDAIQAFDSEWLFTIPIYTLDTLYIYNTKNLALDESIFDNMISSWTDIKQYNWTTK